MVEKSPSPLEVPAPQVIRKLSHMRNRKVLLSTDVEEGTKFLLKIAVLPQPSILPKSDLIPTSNLPSHILPNRFEVRLMVKPSKVLPPIRVPPFVPTSLQV